MTVEKAKAPLQVGVMTVTDEAHAVRERIRQFAQPEGYHSGLNQATSWTPTVAQNYTPANVYHAHEINTGGSHAHGTAGGGSR